MSERLVCTQHFLVLTHFESLALVMPSFESCTYVLCTNVIDNLASTIMSNHLLLLLVVFAVCLSGSGVLAFGAGNIPSFAYLEGKGKICALNKLPYQLYLSNQHFATEMW